MALPWLLRNATRRFGRAARARLEEAGFDLPTSGVWAVRALDGHDRTATQLVSVLNLSKQAVSVLIDGLVDTGLVERQPHPHDRRRVMLALTEQGRVAAKAIRAGTDSVMEDLGSAVSPAELATFHATLVALVDRPET